MYGAEVADLEAYDKASTNEMNCDIPMIIIFHFHKWQCV